MAGAVREPQSSTSIFERQGWAVSCPASRLGWHHTYGSSHVQETMAVLKDKMNKKCVRSYLKSEANNYQPVHITNKDGYKCYPAHFMATVPRNPSPEVIKELEKTSGCKPGQRGKTYLEFPIDEDFYTGGDPDRHRILAIADNRQGQYSNAQYCLTMYHVSTDVPEFRVCTRRT